MNKETETDSYTSTIVNHVVRLHDCKMGFDEKCPKCVARIERMVRKPISKRDKRKFNLA